MKRSLWSRVSAAITHVRGSDAPATGPATGSLKAVPASRDQTIGSLLDALAPGSTAIVVGDDEVTLIWAERMPLSKRPDQH